MVTLKFFAVLKHLIGKGELPLDFEKDQSLENLLDKLKKDLPPLKEGLQEGKILVSVNQEVVDRNYVIQDGDEIAFLPPFAGG